MSEELFRKEAVDAGRGDWLGTINVAMPLARWAWMFLALALAACVVAFLVFGHYTGRATVTGQLVPSNGILGVSSPSSGIISAVDVHAGQTVHRGAPLVEISTETDSATLGKTQSDISRRLRTQRVGLKSDLVTQTHSSQEQAKQLSHQIKLLKGQRLQIRSQLALQKERISSDSNMLQRIKPLADKGYVSAFQVEQQKTQLLQDQGQGKQLKRQLLDVEQQIGDTTEKLAQLPLSLATQRNATQRQLADVDQQLAQNEARREIILRASRDGVISTLLIRNGQAVSAGESLLSILPSGSKLQAQLLVPSTAVGFIRPGSDVVLRYQAYPYQKFGQQFGKIDWISQSALSSSEIYALTGERSSTPLYRVQVNLNSQHVFAYGKAQSLRPGMALDADILVERRTVLEWMFQSLYGLNQRVDSGNSHG